MSKRVMTASLAVVALQLAAATPPPASAYVSYLGGWQEGAGSGPGQFGGDFYGAPVLGGLAVGANGTVYAVDSVNDGGFSTCTAAGSCTLRKPTEQINMYAPDGTSRGSFGSPEADFNESLGTFEDIVGVATAPNGDVYVLDSQRDPSVEIFNSGGQYEAEFSSNPSTCLLTCSSPASIAVDSAGDVFVLYSGYTESVARYSATGTLEQTWGSNGDGPGQFACYAPISYCVGGPTGIAVGSNNLVYVDDTYNDRVEAFTTTGAFVREWPATDPTAGSNFGPTVIGVTSANDVIVSGSGWSTAEVYDSTGHLLTQFGTHGDCQGPDCSTNDRSEVSSPVGLAVAPSGDIYIADPPDENPSYSLAYIQRFQFGDNGTPAPGSIQASDTYGQVQAVARPRPLQSCRVQISGYRYPIRTCGGFLQEAISWKLDCRGTGGVPGWGVALRYASTTAAAAAYYRPAGQTSPIFVPGPPYVASDTAGEWFLPDGTDLGDSDPRTRPVVEFGSAVKPESGVEYHVAASIQPGVDVTPTIRAVCTYAAPDGSRSGNGVDIVGSSISSPPRIAWAFTNPIPTSVPSDRPVQLHLAFLSATPKTPKPYIVVYKVSGAGVSEAATTRGLSSSFAVRPRRAGVLSVSGRLGTERAVNELTIRVTAAQ